jgi:hypothetical protein
MNKLVILILLLASGTRVIASTDTVRVPIERQLFHDKIISEQKLIDRLDGRIDGVIKVSNNDEINTVVSSAIYDRVNQIKDSIEINNQIPRHFEKVRYLRNIETMLKNLRMGMRVKEFNPTYIPQLIDAFNKCMRSNYVNDNIIRFLQPLPYESARIITELFTDNIGYKESKKILFLKFAVAHPDKIIDYITPYLEEPFADSLIVIAAQRNPTAIYTTAQAPDSKIGKLIHSSNDPLVKALVEISKTQNALLYFPFLDDLIHGNKTIADIKIFVGDATTPYDSVGYFKLLVKTEIEYFRRLSGPAHDTPVAMFGPNGLREMLQERALRHFITPINELHDVNNLNVRMRSTDPLSSIDLYYMIVMGENDIYTSSYKHSFTRLIARLGSNPKTDSLLLSVHFDYFKKFIKMAANFNQLDVFLKYMPAQKSQMLMRAFVGNLDQQGSLEDAVDVADAYSSITDKKLLKTILGHVVDYESEAVNNKNERGKKIYGLLRAIFESADSSNHIDLTKAIGIPSIYSIDNKALADDSGRVVQQVFFFGDPDGKGIFTGFVNSFSRAQWSVAMKPEWVEIKSIKGPKVWIYANRPLDNDNNLDDTAQIHLEKYLQDNNLLPSIVVHRGHSYWLPRTLNQMMGNARVVVLGSCGGYKNLSEILEINPDAHIISTKEIGKGDINKPVINYINQTLTTNKPLVWKTMWTALTRQFASADASTREAWDDYIPPYKNLGVIFLKAYTTADKVN